MGRYKCIADNGIAPSAIQYYSIETHCKYLLIIIFFLSNLHNIFYFICYIGII